LVGDLAYAAATIHGRPSTGEITVKVYFVARSACIPVSGGQVSQVVKYVIPRDRLLPLKEGFDTRIVQPQGSPQVQPQVQPVTASGPAVVTTDWVMKMLQSQARELSKLSNEVAMLRSLIEELLQREPSTTGAIVPEEYPLTAFAAFDWAGRGYEVLAQDEDGPTLIQKGGASYKRRSPTNKFGEVIYFSRATGKKEDGSPEYQRILTFKPIAAPDPLPRKVQQVVSNAK
jgi:hypothetical protein